MQETGARQLSSTAYPYLFTLVSNVDHTTGATGKTPVVKLSKNGTAGVSAVGAVTEVDSTNHPGLYALAGNATDRNVLGPCALHITATGCDVKDAQIDIVGYDPFDQFWGIPGFSSLQTITSGQVVAFVNPVNATGTAISLIYGDSYLVADGRSFNFTVSGFPSLIGSTVVLKFKARTYGTEVSFTMTVLSATSFRQELTAAQCITLPEIGAPGVYTLDYDIKATLANGDLVTLVTGTTTVTRVP